jgi:hypothetical protein
MVGITVAQAQEQLSIWLSASAAVAGSQSYAIATEGGSRSLTRADAAEIRQQIAFWNMQVNRLARPGLSIKRMILNDD